MITYLIYIVVFLILLFVIIIGFRAMNAGLEAKNKINKEDFKSDNTLYTEDNIVLEIEKLKKLLDDGTIDEKEFIKAKKKILNK